MTRTASLKHAVCDSIPVKVVRSWEKSADGNGLIMRFKLTNTHTTALKIGGLGFAMPQAGMQHGIEESVWLDPHIGGDHGYVEWVRVVVSWSPASELGLAPCSSARIVLAGGRADAVGHGGGLGQRHGR